MKHLKYFEDFQILDSDTQDVKNSKERMNKLSDQLRDYKSKKSRVDSIFSDKNATSEVIKSKIDAIIGVDSDKKNPFLVDYTSVVRLRYDIEKSLDKTNTDRKEISDLQRDLSGADNTSRDSINKRIRDIQDTISGRNKDINDKRNKLSAMERDHKKKMDDIQKDIMDFSRIL